MRRRYRQILWPRRGMPKFANRLCRHLNVRVHLDAHTIGQTTESDFERGSTLWSIPHGFLPLTPKHREYGVILR
jgi:hypothetical protein